MMARLDIKTLVLAFEKRIEALEKNPPDKINTAVVVTLLEKSIEEVIREHFVHVAKQEIKQCVEEKFQEKKNDFVVHIIENILEDDSLKKFIEEHLKKKLIQSLG